MTSVVALGVVTGGINLPASEAELFELGLTPGSYSEVSGERMEAVRRAREGRRGNLPVPNSGGAVANTAWGLSSEIGRIRRNLGYYSAGMEVNNN